MFFRSEDRDSIIGSSVGYEVSARLVERTVSGEPVDDTFQPLVGLLA